eukprot:INCI12085.1.p1 GENE.INCI12085.1~~INCI12085.1.p1  ORF type:complete len:658 (-),score=153.55 INCI12085.1:14-1987(-)
MNVEESWADFGTGADGGEGSRGGGGGGIDEVGAAILSAAEAERLCEGLQQLDLRDVGTPAWVAQHKVINQLNLQAHHCVKAKSDNFVLESLVTFDKIALLIRELLVVEAWRVQVFPRLKKAATSIPQGGLRLYFIHYHEVALVNLLEIVLYHDYAAEAAGDAILELVDYCARKVAFLTATGAPAKPPSAYEGKSAKEIAAEISSLDPVADIERQAADIDFRTAVVAVFILRFLTAHVPKLSVTVMTRMLETHDLVLAMVPLIENPPWVRKVKVAKKPAAAGGTSSSSGGGGGGSTWAWEKYDDHVWTTVQPGNLLTMSRCEGQPWLVLYNLLCDGECRKFYTFNTFRKDQLLRVRKYLNESLKDQLPVLAEVQRYMDELVIMQAPPPDGSRHFIVQQVPAIRNSIIKGRDWAEEAKLALHAVFQSGAAGNNEDLKQLADVFTADGVAELLGEHGDAALRVVETTPQTCTVSAIDAQGRCCLKVVYELRAKNATGSAVVEQETSAGRFRRYTLSLRASGDKKKAKQNVVLPADCLLQLDVACEEKSLDTVSARSFQLSTNTIAEASQFKLSDFLPAADGGSGAGAGAGAEKSQDALSQLPKVHWQKIGDLEGGCVAQLKLELKKSKVTAAPADSGGDVPMSVYRFGKTAFVSVAANGT